MIIPIDGEPIVETLHLVPFHDWVVHDAAKWCACRPTYGADEDVYIHKAMDGCERYSLNGWVLD